MIKLGEKAKEILKGISVINQGVILRNDYLYTKYENVTEDNNAKGVPDIVVNYTLPENEVQIDNFVGIGSISEFLSIMNTFNQDKLQIEPEGTTIKLKDNRKQVTFYTTTVDALPERSFGGEELFEAGTTVLKFVLDEAEIEKVKKDLSILNIDELSVEGTDNKIKFIASNSITSNDTEISIDESYVVVGNGRFPFPNSNVFDYILKGIYTIEVKSCDYEGTELLICRLSSNTHTGLVYTMVGSE